MTTTTAAQPLDLDNEHIEKIWNSLDGKQIIAGENHLSWDAALRREFAKAIARDVLAQARAAKPESATGTTGASIDTPEFRELLYCLDHTLRRAWASRADDLIAHIDAIIGDLRAQLAQSELKVKAFQRIYDAAPEEHAQLARQSKGEQICTLRVEKGYYQIFGERDKIIGVLPIGEYPLYVAPPLSSEQQAEKGEGACGS